MVTEDEKSHYDKLIEYYEFMQIIEELTRKAAKQQGVTKLIYD